jgi:hypothetical protein
MLQLTIPVACAVSILTCALSAVIGECITASAAADGLQAVALSLTLAATVAAVTYANIPAEVLAAIRRWHGSIDDQFGNLDNLVNILGDNLTTWSVPQQLYATLLNNRDQLDKLIQKCRSTQGSAADRTVRNSLLKTSVGLCLTQVKAWSYSQYYDGVLTADDVHLLGFLLPGEAGGTHERKEPVDVLAEVKVSVVNADFIRVVIDQSSDDNAALVVHGWPQGVHQALIVIVASDGKTEVLRKYTTHLYNDIQMPAGSHGKQFIIKAAFLRHIDDSPLFGPEPTFSMPLNTEDLAAALDRQSHEEFEAHIRETERLRHEAEQLAAAHAAATAGSAGSAGSAAAGSTAARTGETPARQ